MDEQTRGHRIIERIKGYAEHVWRFLTDPRIHLGAVMGFMVGGIAVALTYGETSGNALIIVIVLVASGFVGALIKEFFSFIIRKIKESTYRSAPTIFRRGVRRYHDIAIFAGDLDWIDDPEYQQAMEVLTGRGAIDLIVFCADPEWARRNRSEQVANDLRERINRLRQVHHVGRICYIEGSFGFRAMLVKNFLAVVLDDPSPIDDPDPSETVPGPRRRIAEIFSDKDLIEGIWMLVKQYARVARGPN